MTILKLEMHGRRLGSIASLLKQENVFQLGPNAYSKPATALNILRETIMGPELFDFSKFPHSYL